MNGNNKNARELTKFKNFRETEFHELKKQVTKNVQASKKFQDILEEKFYILEEV